MPVLGLARTHAPFTCQRTEEDGLVERFTRTTRALGIVAAFARPRSCAAAENCERKTSARGRQGSLAGVIASGCHDPSGTRFLPTSFPSLCLVPVQSIVVQAAVFAAPLVLACISTSTLVTHARLTPTIHPLPPTPTYTVHRSLAQHPWVLRLATTSVSGRTRAIRQIIGSKSLAGQTNAARSHAR